MRAPSAQGRSHRFLRPIGILALALLTLTISVALVVFAANWLVETEPVVRLSASSPVNHDYVTIHSDERLFTIMAALNAAGYSEENNPQGMHPVRQAVRAELEAENIPSLGRLRLYFQMHQSMYVTWALQRNNPPAFTRQTEGWWVTGVPPLFFFGLDDTLRDFYREADIAALWKKYKPEYDAEGERYRAVMGPSVQAVLDYLHIQDPPTRRVIVLPNLLDAYWRGYGPRVGDTSYIIMGPSDQPNIGLIQHEAMHPIVNPLVDADLGAIDKADTDRFFARIRPLMPSAYPTWDGILKESVVRAVVIRLADPKLREELIVQEESQGFLLVRPLVANLQDYEQSGETFADYLPKLLASLNGYEIK